MPHPIRQSLRAALLAALLAATPAARAQVVINEILENPPGADSVDEHWEFIELFARPDMDLTGYALVLFKGGQDADRDGHPDAGTLAPEIDEVFSLDGWRVGPNGFFTLVNCDRLGASEVGDRFLKRNPGFKFSDAESPQNKRWIDGATFPAAQAAPGEPVHKLDNTGSSTYVLVRRRPGYSLVDGRAVLSTEYAFRRGVRHDVNFDGRVDRGDEAPIPEIAVAPSKLEPYQVVDEVAWSHRGGHEYTRWSQAEISDTPGLNPDGVSRVRYLVGAPDLGWRTRDLIDAAGRRTSFELIPTRAADESFVYGVLEGPCFPRVLRYFDGFDFDGWPQLKAPTDPSAPRYDGSCDPEPDRNPFPNPCPASPTGQYAMTDLPAGGMLVTPGRFNDHPANPQLRQFRFIPGDANLDGLVDARDLDLVRERLGATLDDVNPDRSYVWQGPGFQQMLVMLAMDPADGPDGHNAPAVTEHDAAAALSLIQAKGSARASRAR